MRKEFENHELVDKLEYLSSVSDIIDRICGIRETNHIMNILISELMAKTDSDEGAISLVADGKTDALSTVIRVADPILNKVSRHIATQVLGWILTNKALLKIDDLDCDPRFHGLDSNDGRYKRLICYPMVVRGEIIGITMLIRNNSKEPYEEKHLRLLGLLVPQSAQILANAKLLEELTKTNELLNISRKKLSQENLQLRSEMESKFAFENIIGRSAGMRRAFTLVSKYCTIDSPVLITGETGTGKDLIARAIHYNSDRKNKPFVVINCGLKTENLLESELFGHIKGSFTGAIRNKIGLFKEADGGTVFLDEIGDAPLSTQVAILRVIQNGEIMPIGATKSEIVNVRIISATNADLKERIAAKNFREDLYYRLNTFSLELPPLRERRDDIPLLVNHFLEKAKIKMGKGNLSITPEALEIVIRYEWPGNIRELESEVERAALTCGIDGVISPKDLSGGLFNFAPDNVVDKIQGGTLKNIVENVEKQVIKRSLAENRGNVLQTSKMLGLTYKGLTNKIKRYKIVLDYKKIVSDK